MTVADQIRKLVAERGFLPSAEILAAVPDAGPNAIHALCKAGHLTRTGTPRHYLYGPGKPPRPYRLSAAQIAERAEQKRQRDRDRYQARKDGTYTPAERKATPKPKPHQHIVIAPSRSVTAPIPQKSAEPESLESYLNRGGRIERLPIHAVSQPLTRIA